MGLWIDTMAHELILDRVRLVPGTVELLEAEDEPARFSQLLQATVPAGWPPGFYDRPAREFFLEVLRTRPDAVGWTVWYVVLPGSEGDSPVVIGAIGACGPPDDQGEIVIGYSIVDSYRGHGYATESLRGFLGWAFGHPELRRIVADTFAELTPSIGVLQKNGFERGGEGHDPGSIRFHRTRERWERNP